MADQHSTCGNCFYYRDQKVMGVCRFFPQNVNKHFTDWCGQHKLRQPTVVALPVVEMRDESQVNCDSAAVKSSTLDWGSC